MYIDTGDCITKLKWYQLEVVLLVISAQSSLAQLDAVKLNVSVMDLHSQNIDLDPSKDVLIPRRVAPAKYPQSPWRHHYCYYL